MINQFKKIKYNSKKQKEKYLEITQNLSLKEKEKLLENLLSENIWAYFQLIVKILFDIASDNEKYIQLLKKVYLKVKNDLGSAPFFNMLIDLGGKKQNIGIKIYNLIQKQGDNEEFIDASGLILGGYSISHEEILNNLLEDKILNYPLTNTIIKAIGVKSIELGNISEMESEFLDFVSKSNDERFLRELMNFYIISHRIDPNYFYNKIKELMEKNNRRVNGMIFIRIKKLGLSTNQFLELANLTKDCDEYALGEVISALALDNHDYSDNEEFEEIVIYSPA